MLRLLGMIAVLLAACGDEDCCKDAWPDAASDGPSDGSDSLDGTCAGGGRDKIKFSRAESCANDGSVEWCVPEDDTELRATLTAIEPAITCAPGGGRARCNLTPGLLLCSYPTRYPEECLAPHGEMKPEVWDDMCAIAALPAITEIVPTWFE